MTNKNNFDILIGLRSPTTSPLERNGAFIASKRVEDQYIKICTFHDGAEIIGVMCSPDSLNSQLTALKDREWMLMGDSDIYVTCHGMGEPQTPFWNR